MTSDNQGIRDTDLRSVYDIRQLRHQKIQASKDQI